jgi:hypothetical protein
MTQILPQQPKNRPRKKPSGHVTGRGMIELLAKSTGQSKRQTELFLRNLGCLIAEEIIKGKSVHLLHIGAFRAKMPHHNNKKPTWSCSFKASSVLRNYITELAEEDPDVAKDLIKSASRHYRDLEVKQIKLNKE